MKTEVVMLHDAQSPCYRRSSAQIGMLRKLVLVV